MITRLAREYAAAGAAAAYGRLGVSTQEFGLVSSWALHCLNLLTGNLDREGGMMTSSPAVDIIGQGVTGRGAHGRWRSRVRGLPETSGELPVSTLADEILTPGEGQVRGLLTIAGNPALSTPDGKRLSEALEQLDFMVSVDLYLNETTRHADVVLPPTSLLERDHYDVVLHALGVRNTARYTEAVFPKPAGARHDWEIFRDLALGLTRRREQRTGKRPGLVERAKRELRLRTSPTILLDLLLRRGPAKLSVRALKQRPEGVDLGPLEPRFPARLQTKDKRVQLAQPLVLDDLERVRTLATRPDSEELLLIGRRHQRDCNSWMHNTERLTKGKERHQLLAHPDDLASRGIEDGARVAVTSRVGKVEVEVRATDDMMPGRGVPAPRLRPRSLRHPPADTPTTCRGSTSTTSPTPSTSTSRATTPSTVSRCGSPPPPERVARRPLPAPACPSCDTPGVAPAALPEWEHRTTVGR